MKTAIRILFLTLLLAWICQTSFSQVIGDYQSNAALFNWTDAGSWQSWSASGWIMATTYPGEISGTGKVTIRNGQTVTINVSPANAIESLQVGEALSGILQFDQSVARTLTVSNIVTIAAGGLFQSAAALSTGTITTHSLVVGGSIINDGTLDFSAPAGAGGTTANASGAGITFTGAGNSTLNCQDAVRTNLRKSTGLVLDKDASSVLVFTPGGSFQVLSANADGFLDIRKGTFRLIGTNPFSNPVFNAATYTIPVNGGFELSNDNASLTAQNGTLTINGHLSISNGTFNAGTVADNSLVTVSGGVFSLTGGTVHVAGRFKLDDGSGILSGGTLNVAAVGYSSLTEAAFHVTGPGALSVSGTALITLAHPNANGTPFNDLELISGSGLKTITGGTFQIGTAATTTSSTFRINSESTLYNLTVFNSYSRASLIHDLTVNNLLTLNGPLLLNTKNVILGAAAPAVAGTLGTGAGMVVPGNGAGGGGIRKYFSSTGAYVFPFGDEGGSTDYLPVNLSLTNGVVGAGAYATVNAIDSKHPANANGTDFLNRYWLLTTNNISSPAFALTATYAGSDIAGTEANLTAAWYDGTKWVKGSVADQAANTISLSGLSDLTAGFSGISNIPPTVTILNGATVNSCLGTAVQLNTAVTGDPVIAYSWSPAAGLSSAVTANPTANPPATTTYTLTITDGNGITATDDIAISISPVPTANPPADQNYCDGSLTTPLPLTGTPPGVVFDLGSGAAVGLAGQTGITSIPAFTPITGTAVLSITPRANGCTGTAVNYTVTVNPIPAATATPAIQTICSGTAPSIALTGNFGGIAFSWTVVQSGVSGATAGSGSVIAQTLTSPGAGGTATYTITPTANGCSGTPVIVTITLSDTEKPVLSGCPANQSVSTGAGLCSAVVSWTEPTAADNCTASGSLVWTKSHTPGSIFAAGTTTVTYSATDAAGNISNVCSFTITVSDTEKPVVSGCPANQSVSTGAGLCSAVVSWTEPTAADNCTASGSLVWTKSHTPGSIFAAGTTTVTYSATDAAGNISNPCSFTITVSDTEKPVLSGCPANQSVSTGAGLCSAVVSWTEPTAADNCTASGSLVWTKSHTPGSIFAAGTTTVTYSATDVAGNISNPCSFTITVSDTEQPVVVCPANSNVDNAVGFCYASVVAGTATATDNCNATPAVSGLRSDGLLLSSNYPVGLTTIIWTASDGINTSSCAQTITVFDVQDPVFTAPGAITVYTNSSCTAITDPAVTGSVTGKSDNCTAAASLVVSYVDGASTPGACAGNYSFVRTWKVTDAAGNDTEKTQQIAVNDNVKPVMTAPPAISLSCEQGTLPAVAGTATATDNCGGTVTLSYSDSQVNGTCAGNYVITRTWTATDCSGNLTTATQVISVSDVTKPIASIPNKAATCPSTIPLAYASYAEFVANGGVATDNCGAVTVVLYDEVANGLDDKPGYCPDYITRTYRVTDACGNFTDVSQKITVAGSCGCSPCTTGTNFHLADFLGMPTGSLTFSNQGRVGKCCDAKSNERCISFNVRIDDDAVGIEILIDGATPSAQDWRIDCNSITMTNSTVCIPGGKFYLFTYCKPGANLNTFTFRSLPGIVSSENITTRVECSGQISTSGIVSNPQWTSIWPGTTGQYNAYLSSTTVANPTFLADGNAPPVIKYQICGTIGSSLCNALGVDCDTISVFVKQAIAVQLNADPTVVCQNNIPSLVANISPAGATYTYEWYTGSGATGSLLSSGLNSYTPTAAGLYSIKVTDTQNGVPCSISIFNFEVIFDVTGASVFTPPSGNLSIECNNPNASQLIQNWLATAIALDENGNPLPVNNNFAGITHACGTDLTVSFSASDHCGNVGTAVGHILIVDTQVPSWSTVAASLNRTVACDDIAALAEAQALVPVPADLCDATLAPVKTTGLFTAGACAHSGTYTNTWLATDDCSNTSAVFTQLITVTDVIPPVIVTPAQNLTVECNGSGNATDLANWLAAHAGAAATDACGGAISWTNNYTALSDLCGATGAATVTFTATDVCGNSSITQGVFTISDTQAPVISCPAPVTGTSDQNECFTVNLVLGTATATDNCSTPVITNNAPAQFPVGTTTVTWTATDVCGNIASCTQTVTVTDNNQAPVIACPANVEQTALAGNCSLSNVTIPDPVSSDNCAVVRQTWQMSGVTTGSSPATGINVAGGQTFNVGITTVVYTVADAAGNSANCSFTVWIKDLQKPVFSSGCPANVSQAADAGLCTTTVTVPVPPVSDPCNEGYTVVNSFNSTNNASGTYPVGITNVLWTITDASGNVTTCTQVVTVTDSQLPLITCPANVEQTALAGNCFLDNVTIPDPVSSDNCAVVRQTWQMSGVTTGSSPATGINVAGGQTFNVGITTVVYTVADAAGNSANCSFTVWIKDLQKPVFSSGCPANVSQAADAGLCTTTVTVPVPPVSDPCNESYTVVNSFNSTSNASGTYPVGITNVLWTITDASGNVTTCTQVVTVTDSQLPLITCPANVEQTALAGNCALSNVTIPNPVSSDNCAVVLQTWQMSGATTGSSPAAGIHVAGGQTFNVGITTVAYTVADASGNTATCSFTVWIKDLQKPVFSSGCPVNVSQAADAGLCTAAVTVPVPPVSDPCNEGYTVVNSFNSTSNASGNFPVGITNVLWTITDASGNVTTCTQVVTVNDTQLPVIACPANVEQTALAGNCALSNVTIPNPVSSDNCAVVLQTWQMSGATTGSSPAAGIHVAGGQTFNVGITTVAYTVADASGNTATCSFTVWIKDLQKPVFSSGCPVNVSRTADAGLCTAAVTVPVPPVSDPCNDGYTVVNSFNSTSNASGNYPVGTTTVNWTITDGSGNTTTCTQIVVIDDLLPVLTCPADVLVQADFDKTFASNVAVPLPAYSDNCPGLILTWILTGTTAGSSPLTGVNTVPTPAVFNVGATLITYRLTDSNGHLVTCSFTVTVESKPDITCRPDITGNTDAGLCTASINPGMPLKNAGAEPITWTWSMTGATTATGSGAIGAYPFGKGVTTIEWLATNVSGSDNCSHTVTITDVEKPSFILPSLNVGYCVEPIYQAVYNFGFEGTPTDLTFLRPDYYLFGAGSTMLNLSSVADNCTLAASPIAWSVDFGNNGSFDLSGTGQLSTWGLAIQFPLGANRVSYTVTDASGNLMSQFVDLVVVPRPDITKNF